MRKDVAVLAAAGPVVFTLALSTGGLTSPFGPLVSIWLFLAAWRFPPQASAFAIGSSAGVLALAGASGGLAVPEAALLLGLVLAGAAPAATLRRAAGKPVQTAEPPPPQLSLSESERREEEMRALHELGDEASARRVVLWEVEGETGTARQFASSDGDLSIVAVAIRGEPMGWVWQHGVSLRLSPTPSWAAPDATVVALRVARATGSAALVTLEFASGSEIPDFPALERALGPLQRMLMLREERALAAADRGGLETLVSALRRLPSHADLSGFANGVLDDALRMTSATGGALGIWVRDEGRIVAVVGDDGGPPLGGTFEPLESEMALAARGGSLIVRESRTLRGERVAIATPGDRWPRSPRCIAALPLSTPDAVVGVLAVWSSAASRFEPATLELLRTLAPFAAWQLAHILEYGGVSEDGTHDGLTGLHNRISFDAAFDAERARHERYGHPLALLLIDVDHFKGLNDRFGQAAGDAVLRAVARILQAGVRDVDLCARFGGEEFAVLLPETSSDAAGEVAERLRASVERIELPWAGETIKVRVSIGVSSCPACVRDPRTLVRSADAALYQAKSMGRNRVIRAPVSG